MTETALARSFPFWERPDKLLSHKGKLLQENTAFPISPPLEIGRIKSADSSIGASFATRSNKQHFEDSVRSMAFFSAIFIPIALLVAYYFGFDLRIAAFLGLAAGFLAVLSFNDDTQPFCSFVGKQGFVE